MKENKNVIRFFALVIIIILTSLIMVTGCNKQIFDTTYKFNKAIIALPNGEIIEGDVESWTDYADGDQLQIKINGVTYLCHSSDVVLIKE